MSADQEVCVIVCAKERRRFHLFRRFRFVARALNPTGVYTVAEGTAFGLSWWRHCRDRCDSLQPLPDDKGAQKSYAALVERLIGDGWHPVRLPRRHWYSMRFRRLKR
jgi:hypothetical protein